MLAEIVHPLKERAGLWNQAIDMGKVAGANAAEKKHLQDHYPGYGI